jgi:hypothetical protein
MKLKYFKVILFMALVILPQMSATTTTDTLIKQVTNKKSSEIERVAPRYIMMMDIYFTL